MSDLRVDYLIQFCHDNAHAAEHDLEDDYVFFTLSRRDIWLACLGALLVQKYVACLTDEAAEVLERLSEALDVQKPHWRGQ